MSFFGNLNKSSYDIPVFEAGSDVEVNGDLIAIEEGYEDQLAIIEALHTLDMAEIDLKKDLKNLTESSEIEARQKEYEAVVENVISNAWDRLKQFFLNMLGKLQAFFKTIVRFFDGLFRSGKKFVSLESNLILSARI
jgi:hypothetical protein